MNNIENEETNDSNYNTIIQESLNSDNENNFKSNTSNLEDLKQLLSAQKEKFSNNIEEYIFELQEAIRKTREGV